MPDISMCRGEGCPLRDKCYRFTAEPNEFLQSWFTTPPYEDGACTMMMPNKIPILKKPKHIQRGD